MRPDLSVVLITLLPVQSKVFLSKKFLIETEDDPSESKKLEHRKGIFCFFHDFDSFQIRRRPPSPLTLSMLTKLQNNLLWRIFGKMEVVNSFIDTGITVSTAMIMADKFPGNLTSANIFIGTGTTAFTAMTVFMTVTMTVTMPMTTTVTMTVFIEGIQEMTTQKSTLTMTITMTMTMTMTMTKNITTTKIVQTNKNIMDLGNINSEEPEPRKS